MAVSIEVHGINKVSNFLKNTDKKIQVAADKAITEAGFFMEGEVKQSIAGKRAEKRSVDTGRFLGSVKNVKVKKFVTKVETNVEYAQGLEYGTSKIAPRRHFSNSAARNKHKVQEFVNKKIKEAT